MEKMKRLNITMVLLFIAMIIFAKERPQVKYLEETELVSVVAHLANVPGYNWGEEDVLNDYLADVDAYFAPYKDHPAVKLAKDDLSKHGFSWNFPVAVGLRFNLVNGKIIYRKELVADYNGHYDHITKKNEKKFLKLLQDFYKKSNFQTFYDNHRPLYTECEKAMQVVVDMIDFNWYDSFFGPKEKCEQNVYIGLLNGNGNYAIHNMKKDGTEIVDALMGCCGRLDGKIYYGASYTLPIIIHEFNHSYCNPLNDEIWDEISAKATAFYTPNAEFYKKEAYGNPHYVMNETFVEACMIRYLMSHPELDLNGVTVEDYIQIDIDKKFYMIRDIIKVLEERESHPELYKTMHDFMPRYVETITNY